MNTCSPWCYVGMTKRRLPPCIPGAQSQPCWERHTHAGFTEWQRIWLWCVARRMCKNFSSSVLEKGVSWASDLLETFSCKTILEEDCWLLCAVRACWRNTHQNPEGEPRTKPPALCPLPVGANTCDFTYTRSFSLITTCYSLLIWWKNMLLCYPVYTVDWVRLKEGCLQWVPLCEL